MDERGIVFLNFPFDVHKRKKGIRHSNNTRACAGVCAPRWLRDTLHKRSCILHIPSEESSCNLRWSETSVRTTCVTWSSPSLVFLEDVILYCKPELNYNMMSYHLWHMHLKDSLPSIYSDPCQKVITLVALCAPAVAYVRRS